MKRSLILLTAVIVMILGVTSNSEEQTDHEFRVQVSVSSKDDSFEGLVKSYINRELRSLRDVEIVYSNPQWKLSILAMPLSLKSGYKTGLALSIVVLPKFDNQLLTWPIPEDARRFITLMTSGLYHYPGHLLYTGSNDDLRKLCDEIVADFDTDYLEKARKSLKKYTR